MLTAENPAGSEVRSDFSEPFRSFSEARQEHLALLRKKSGAGENYGMLVDGALELTRRLQATGAVVWDEKERSILQGLLDYWSSFLDREGIDAGANQLDTFDWQAAPELPEESCPYFGLEAFQQENSKFFFGREQVVREIADRLGVNRFVAVIGASGSGKSSIVRAGLLPILRADDEWRTFDPMIPGAHPLNSVAAVLRIDDKDGFAERCKKDEKHFVRVLNETGKKPAIFIIDQFEELFTLCSRQDEQLAFLRNLRMLVSDDSPGHRVLVTIREDYTNFCAKDADLHQLFEKGQIRLGPLGAEALAQVIRKPAELAGLRFEEGIVEDLIAQVLGDPAALPLLQFTLFELWNKRSRNVITWQAYKQLGRVRDALGHRADAIYESMLVQDQDATKRVFVRLARFSETMEVTSRRVSLAELERIFPGRVPAVIERLVRARLLKAETGADGFVTIEVAHEALIRNWPRLVDWLDEARSATRQHLRLADAAVYWSAHNHDPAALLQGPRLSEAEAYAHANNNLSDLETAFLQASSALERKTEKRRRLVKLARNVLGAYLAAAIVALIVWSALLVSKQSNFNRTVHNIVSQESLRDYAHSMLLLIAAMQRPNRWMVPFLPDSTARADLLELLSHSPVFGEAAVAVGISKDGSKLVVLAENNRVSILDLRKETGYLRKEGGHPRAAMEYVGTLPPASRPQDAGFISAGYVAGMGAVVHRGGSLTWWTSDHNPNSIQVAEHLSDEAKAKIGQQIPWVDFVDDRVKVTVATFNAPNPEYMVSLLGSEHLVAQDPAVRPSPTSIMLRGDRIGPVFSHDGQYAYLERDTGYRPTSLVVGSLKESITTRLSIPPTTDGALAAPAIGFVRNSDLVVFRDRQDSLKVARPGETDMTTYQIQHGMQSYAPSLNPFQRPPLAAAKIGDRLWFAWPDQSENARILKGELNNGQIDAQALWLSGLEGVSQLSFDESGRFVIAIQSQWGGRARVRVWDSTRTGYLNSLSDDDLQDEACRVAASQGPLSAFFRQEQSDRGVRGENYQPCAGRLQPRPSPVAASQGDRPR
jgi:hypothetical protein